MSAPIAKTKPAPTDAQVGGRVRMRRQMLKMSQKKIGNALGLTFQQVQKCEKGTNRIGASKLQQIAKILDVPVSFFFGSVAGVSEENQPVMDVLNTANTLRLMRSVSRIESSKVQQAIVVLVEQVARKDGTD